MNILCLNAGSSSLKYKLLQIGVGDPSTETVLLEGSAERSGDDATTRAAAEVIGKCIPLGVDAIGHRVVHGGPDFSEPTRVTPAVLETLRSLRPLDLLHNPTEVAVIEAGQRLLPGAAAVAVFDTAFHRTLPEVAYRYALPRALTDAFALRRYGFHGLSHRFVSERLIALLGRGANGTRLIICHLGSGASVCAVRDGASIDTSMGLTPLEGLVMGTRSGDVDPGLLLYLLRSGKRTPEQLDDLLNHDSGLKGVSGTSADVRDLEQAAGSGDAAATLALDLFAYRVRKYIGAYAAALGGLDAVAFTGGIGEHGAAMRARICQGLTFLGITLDGERNGSAAGKGVVSVGADAAPVAVWVIPTDEERQLAREVWGLLR